MDIMCFWCYLGEQYRNKNNVVQEFLEDYVFRQVLFILSIYFFGYKFEYIIVLVIWVNWQYIDVVIGEEIEGWEIFIESFMYDSIII